MPTHRLWTPIANALEAYRRRVIVESEHSYEHIWRLIHIQEALAVALGSLLVTRLASILSESPSTEILEGLCEDLTGLRSSAGAGDDGDEVEPSPLGGSIHSWIELLRRFGRAALVPGDPFLDALSAYLSSTPGRPLAFADAWARIAPVPEAFRSAALDRVSRLGAINAFRNKLAHVPVSQRLLGDLHRGLRVEVLDGLTDRFNPETDASFPGFVAVSYREPLVGVLYLGGTYVTGSSEVGIDRTRAASALETVACYGEPGSAVEWAVAPFFRIDSEAKAALLFRVSDLQREPGATGYSGEYHRFAAELEPVTYHAIPAEVIHPWIPRETASEVGEALVASPSTESESSARIEGLGSEPLEHTDQRQVSASTPRELRQLAEEAFSRRDYEGAAAHFEALALAGDPLIYNDVARSKHGAALWRAADRTAVGDELEKALERAVALLRRAERHRDSRHAARSAYEGSKALWHQWRATGRGELLIESLAAAERAVGRSPDEAFIGWQARVKRDVEIAFPQGAPERPTPNIELTDDLASSPLAVAKDAAWAARQLGRRGRYSEAASVAQAAVDLDPMNAGAWRSLATSRSQLGEHDRAREAWSHLDSLSGSPHDESDSSLHRSLLEVRTNWNSARAWEQAAKLHDRIGRGADVLSEALLSLDEHPEAHAAMLPAANWLVNQHPEEVGQLLAAMRRLQPENTHYLHLAGVARRKAGFNKEAEADLRLACEQSPDKPNYWYALGRCLEDSGLFSEALAAFSRAVECEEPPHRKAAEHLKALIAQGYSRPPLRE